MSYARFGWEGSNVYVYADVGGYLNCCACILGDDGRFYSTGEMLNHLVKHRMAGHTVPDSCIEELEADREENDAWLDT